MYRQPFVVYIQIFGWYKYIYIYMYIICIYISLSLSPHDIVTVSPLTPHISVINTRFFWVSWCFSRKYVPLFSSPLSPFSKGPLGLSHTGQSDAGHHAAAWSVTGSISDWKISITLKKKNMQRAIGYWDIPMTQDFPQKFSAFHDLRGLRSHVFCVKDG